MSDGRVAKNTAYLVAAFVGQKVLSFVYFTLVARAIGEEGTGMYVIATSFTTIFSVFVDLGLSNVLVREVAKFPEKAGTFLANVLGIKVVLAFLAVIAATVAAWLLGYSADIRMMIAVASVVMVLDSVHLVFYSVMRGFQNLRYEAIGVVSGQAVTIAAGAALYAVYRAPIAMVFALLCGSAWNVLWSSVMIRRAYPEARPRVSLDPAIVTFFWGVTVPFALAGIFSRVYSYIDSIMLSKLGSTAEVGVYGTAYKLAFAFQFLPMSFAAAVYPAMSDYYVRDREKLGRIFEASSKYLTFMVMPLAFGIAALAHPLIATVYGSRFMGAVVPLQVLAFSLVFAFLYWPAGSLLNACDRQSKNTWIMGVTMVINIVANALLLPKYGAVGAAIAALIGNFVLWAGALIAARGVTPFNGRVMLADGGKALFAASFMALTVTILREHVHFALTVPVAVVVYGAVLVGVGGVSIAEVKTLLAVFLRRGKKFSDIVSS